MCLPGFDEEGKQLEEGREREKANAAFCTWKPQVSYLTRGFHVQTPEPER